MKKAIIVVFSIAVSLAMIGCATKSGSYITPKLSGVPAFVNKAYKNASEDVLVGVGTYKIGNDTALFSQAKTLAETRARTDISRQLNIVVRNMIQDTTLTSELDEKARAQYSASVTETLSKSTLIGSSILQMDTVDGLVWVVMQYSKSAAMAAVNEAAFNANEAAQRLIVPAAINELMQEKMDKAFSKAAGEGPKPVME